MSVRLLCLNRYPTAEGGLSGAGGAGGAVEQRPTPGTWSTPSCLLHLPHAHTHTHPHTHPHTHTHTHTHRGHETPLSLAGTRHSIQKHLQQFTSRFKQTP